jgi:hypothetical protein
VQIRVGYELTYDVPLSTPMLLTVHIHYSRAPDLVVPDNLVHRFHETDQLREIPFVPPDVVGADPLCSTDEHHGSATEGGGDRDW